VKGVKSWYYGWKATLRLHLFGRATLRHLRELMDPADFEEVPRPEEPEGGLDAGEDS